MRSKEKKRKRRTIRTKKRSDVLIVASLDIYLLPVQNLAVIEMHASNVTKQAT